MDTDTNSSSSNEWELSKENVQPLKHGRKVAPLTAALAPTSFSYQSKIHQEKQVFESELRTYQGDDYLDVWYKYILWMAETYPTGGSEMSQLLERCITLFKDQEKYKDDEQYLKIWIRYADLCANPIDIYNYMYSQDMFSLQALFYESWAVVLESEGDLKRADEAYNLGVQRNAQPLDRLKRQLRAFETRLAESVHTANETNDMAEQDQTEAQRTALGGLKASKKGKVGAKRVGNATLSCKGGIGQVAPQKPNSKGGFTVFMDEIPSQAGGLPAATGTWQEPPTSSVITRENTQKPGKWTKSSHSYQASTPLDTTNQKPSFTVHVDEDAPIPPRTPQTNFPGMSHVLSSRKPEKATNDPLRNISKADNPVTFKVMYCKDKVYAGMEEYSFEEIRAASIFARIRAGNYLGPPMDEEPSPTIEYKVMYPKKEVYNFYEELQWEEVRAKHYFARLAQKKNTVTPAPRDREVRVQPEPMDVGPTGEPFLEVSMEVASCRKAQPDTEGVFVRANAQVEGTSQVPQVRRGLSFTSASDQGMASATGVAMHCTPYNPPVSAFRPVQRSISDTQPPVEGLFADHHSLSVLAPDAPFSLTATEVAPATHSSTVTSSARVPLAASSLATQTKLPPAHTPCKPGELNCSWLCGPSPTVNTRQAMAEVMAMFNNPLETDHLNADLDEVDREFEDAFDNPNGQRTEATIAGPGASGGIGGLGFVVYDETASQEDLAAPPENQENRPPNGYLQTHHRRLLTGVLQPSVGIPVSSEDIEEEKDNFMEVGQDNPLAENPVMGREKSGEPSLPDETVSNTTASADFSVMARMASTPFCVGLDQPTLPNIPCSTIRPNVETNQFSVQTENDDQPENPSNYATFAQDSGSFVCTPNSKLSPIMEKSNESVVSLSSRSSSSGGLSHHTVVSVSELSQIHEEPSTSRIFHEQPLDQSEIHFKKDGTTDINPFADDVEGMLLGKVHPPVSAYEGFYQSDSNLPEIAAKLVVGLGTEDLFCVKGVAGSGAFAKVYKATKIDMDRNLGDFNWNDSLEFALKVTVSPTTWEFYICRQLHERIIQMGLPREMHDAFMDPASLYIYNNGSVLVDQYLGHGTLLDIVNKYKRTNSEMSESVAVRYTIDLLKAVDTAHRCGIIHGDIKPDNFLVLDSDVSGGDEDAQSLKLIDFGRSLDMKLFPSGTSFTINCHTDAFQCIEMKTKRPWTTQVDTYGLLGTVHCILYGEYMKVYQEGGKWHPTKTVKRHWNHKLWSKLFESLLNIPSCQEQPSLSELCREFVEYHQADIWHYRCAKKRHDVKLFHNM